MGNGVQAAFPLTSDTLVIKAGLPRIIGGFIRNFSLHQEPHDLIEQRRCQVWREHPLQTGREFFRYDLSIFLGDGTGSDHPIHHALTVVTMQYLHFEQFVRHFELKPKRNLIRHFINKLYSIRKYHLAGRALALLSLQIKR